MPNVHHEIIVIGGGPAGMMAAITAARAGSDPILLEKNPSLGRKLCITGKGRGNLTNDCDPEELIRNIPENGRFLYSAFSVFSNRDLVDFFHGLGVPTKTERGKRVFPVSDQAKDLKEALLKEIKRLKIPVLYNTGVSEILTDEAGALQGVLVDGGDRRIDGRAVIVATGGMSYPLTGSTGDGYVFAEKFGHKITEPQPGLVGIRTKERYPAEMSGLTLKNAAVRFTVGEKEIYRDFGELLFTHVGVSGPVVLSASFALAKYGYRDAVLHIDLKPALSETDLDKRILRDFEKYQKRIFENSFSDLLPASMIPVIVKLSGIPGDRPVSAVTKEERKKLCELLKNLELHVNGPCSMDEAIVTIGGVSTKEISPKTMESKRLPGLYFAGEVMDVTGYTGGFNLTAAFSSGYLAGKSAAERSKKQMEDEI